MASFKNVNTDYTLTCNDGNGLFTINAETLFNGNVTYIYPSVTTAPFITVAANNTGAITDGGLLMQTGPITFAGLRFNTLVNAWQTSNSVSSNGAPVTSYSNIGNTAAGSNTQIQYNYNGGFAASAYLTFDQAANALTLTGHQVFTNVVTPPANVANAVVVYGDTVGSGGTGLYTTSAAAGGVDELVANYKAIVYGIIF
jgi:hypothetical protein